MAYSLLLPRFQECLVGLAVGDALGAPLEGMSRSEISTKLGRVAELWGGGWLEVKPGEHTDATEMVLCIALWLQGRVLSLLPERFPKG